MIDPALMAQASEECTQLPDDSALKNIRFLAEKLQRLAKQAKFDQEVAEESERQRARCAELELPDAMRAIGMTSFQLLDGSSVEVNEETYANIPAPESKEPGARTRRAAAFAWLRGNGAADLIKNEIKALFGKGDDAAAADVRAVLDEKGVRHSTAESVHWATLRSFVKEQDAKGSPVPADIFGVHKKQVATITKGQQ